MDFPDIRKRFSMNRRLVFEFFVESVDEFFIFEAFSAPHPEADPG